MRGGTGTVEAREMGKAFPSFSFFSKPSVLRMTLVDRCVKRMGSARRLGLKREPGVAHSNHKDALYAPLELKQRSLMQRAKKKDGRKKNPRRQNHKSTTSSPSSAFSSSAPPFTFRPPLCCFPPAPPPCFLLEHRETVETYSWCVFGGERYLEKARIFEASAYIISKGSSSFRTRTRLSERPRKKTKTALPSPLPRLISTPSLKISSSHCVREPR